MNLSGDKGLQIEDERLEQAVEWFLRVRSESARIEDLSELRRWIDENAINALAYQQVSATWGAFDEHASAPEIVVGRRDALLDSRRAGPHGSASGRIASATLRNAPALTLWALAACLVIAIAAGAWWILLPQSTVYSTALGQQRTVVLADASVVALDAQSRVRVRYTDKERAVSLEQGQARFTVAKDLLRPFRVRARDQTVVALGTEFDVELISRTVRVTLIEGHVAVADAGQQGRAATGKPFVELTAGQALSVHDDGRSTVVDVDLNRATAWRRGKMFFDNEPLSSAVERINRYARQQVEVDPAVAAFGVSGAFNAGDTDAFIDAVTNYFPVEAVHDRGTKIYLTRRN
jgi:transmembrane sensor